MADKKKYRINEGLIDMETGNRYRQGDILELTEEHAKHLTDSGIKLETITEKKNESKQ